LLIPYAIVLHASAWFTRLPETPASNCWIYHKLINGIGLSYRFEVLLSTILILLHAIILGRITSKYKLNPDGQLFGSLFFILFCGFHFTTLNLNATLFANLFLTLAIYELFGIYQKKNASLQLFNFGFLIGMASLFYTPYYIFLFLGFIGIVILRGTRFKEYFQLLGGFVNVYLLVFAILYILNLDYEFWMQQIIGFFSPFIFSMKFSSSGWVAFLLLIIFIVVNLMHYQFFQSKRSIIVQKQYDLLFWALFVALWSVFFLKIDQINQIIVLFTPLALLTGMLLTKIKNPLLKETLHLFLVITSLFLQFQNW
jgi:hypothetical protein